MPANELIFDPGVLAATPLLEYQGFAGALQSGGAAVLPWRARWLEASGRGARAVQDVDALGDERFGQCLVHLQKSRTATWLDLRDAWRRLEPSGRLLLCGGNELGIVSAVKRLAAELDQRARVLTNRRHARVVSFRRDGDAAPDEPTTTTDVLLPMPDGTTVPLVAAPGVFSAKRLDSGTELLLDVLPEMTPPKRLLDMGCGIGALGLAALLRWPDARGWLLDGDARAVASARLNASSLDLDDRCQTAWWDASEPCPGSDFDLVLLNPPFHTHKHVDLAPARTMFERVIEVLSPRGCALIVANRTLPWERDLSTLGRMKCLRETRGYKVLSLQRRPRSASKEKRRA